MGRNGHHRKGGNHGKGGHQGLHPKGLHFEGLRGQYKGHGGKFVIRNNEMEELIKTKRAQVEKEFITNNPAHAQAIAKLNSLKESVTEQAREEYKAAHPRFAARAESIKQKGELHKVQQEAAEQATKKYMQDHPEFTTKAMKSGMREQWKKTQTKGNETGKEDNNKVGDTPPNLKHAANIAKFKEMQEFQDKKSGSNKALKGHPTAEQEQKDSVSSGGKSEKVGKDFVVKRAEYKQAKAEVLKNNPDFAAKRVEYKQSKAEVLNKNTAFAEQRAEYKQAKAGSMKDNPDFAAKRVEYKQSKAEVLNKNTAFAEQREAYKQAKAEVLKNNPDFAAQRVEYKQSKAEWMKSNPFTTLSELVVPKHYEHHDPYHDPMKDVAVKGADSGFHKDTPLTFKHH